MQGDNGEEGQREKMDEDLNTFRRSLEFLGPNVKDFGVTRPLEETLDPGTG